MEQNHLKRLTFKHTSITILVVFISGTFLSLFQIGYDISENKKRVQKSLYKLIDITEESASQALYHLDKNHGEKIINGYIKHDLIINAELLDNFGQILAARSLNQPVKNSLFTNLFLPEKETIKRNLAYSPGTSSPIKVGTMHIEINYSNLHEKFIKKIKIVLIFDLLMHILLAVIIALIFFKTLTSPLLKISSQVALINPLLPENNELRIPKNHEYDEMGSLIKNINQILKKYSDLKNQLEIRVDQRTSELNKANKTLKKSLFQLNKAKNHLVETEKMASLGGLVAGISHEINTPVGNCLTAASYLQGKIEEVKQKIEVENITIDERNVLLETADEAMDIIMINLKRAASLISSFKQIAVDQTYSSIIRFNLNQRIEDTLISLKPRLKTMPVSINFHSREEINVYQDPGIFSQIITNLVMNSLIHGFEDGKAGKITIMLERKRKNIIFKYFDSGKGVDKKDRKKIFEPFFTTKKNSGGSGLGLNIVYNLVTQKLHGKIKCSRIKNKQGVCFYIIFPHNNLEK